MGFVIVNGRGEIAFRHQTLRKIENKYTIGGFLAHALGQHLWGG